MRRIVIFLLNFYSLKKKFFSTIFEIYLMITIVKYYMNTIQRKFVGLQKILKFKIFIENVKKTNIFQKNSFLKNLLSFLLLNPRKYFKLQYLTKLSTDIEFMKLVKDNIDRYHCFENKRYVEIINFNISSQKESLFKILYFI